MSTPFFGTLRLLNVEAESRPQTDGNQEARKMAERSENILPAQEADTDTDPNPIDEIRKPLGRDEREPEESPLQPARS